MVQGQEGGPRIKSEHTGDEPPNQGCDNREGDVDWYQPDDWADRRPGLRHDSRNDHEQHKSRRWYR